MNKPHVPLHAILCAAAIIAPAALGAPALLSLILLPSLVAMVVRSAVRNACFKRSAHA